MIQPIEIHDAAITACGIAAEAEFARVISVDALTLPDLNATTVGFDDPMFNVVVESKTTDELLDDRINKIKKFYEAYPVSWTWLVGKNSQPYNLDQKLLQRGFSLLEEIPAMYLDLKKKTSSAFLSNSMELKIEEAANHLHDWIIPIDDAFEDPSEEADFHLLFENLPHGSNTNLRHFVGYYQNQPAAALTLFFHQDSVSLYNFATAKKFQGKGLGCAMLIYSLNFAKNLGYQHYFLASSGTGFNLYRKLGFKIYYIWKVFLAQN